MDHVRVPVLAPLPQAPDHDEVAVEPRVVGALHHGARSRPPPAASRSAAMTSNPLWRRPPLRGAPNWPTGPRVPCGPRTGKKCRWSSTDPGVLLVSARHPDRDPIGPVRHRPAAVRQPVPRSTVRSLAWLEARAASIVRTSSSEPEILIVTSAGAEPLSRNSIRTPPAESVKPRFGETEAFWTTATSAAVRRGDGHQAATAETDQEWSESASASRGSYRCSITRSTILYSFASSALMK